MRIRMKTLKTLGVRRAPRAVTAAALIMFGTVGIAYKATEAQMRAPAVPAVHRHIYPEIAQAEPDVKAALAEARSEKKRVLMIFGGDWCGDCQVLDINLRQPENQALLEKSYVVVHVNIGHMDQNVELAQRYGVPLKRGVPAVSVVSGTGKVVHAQETGEFADMRNMDPRSVNQFLMEWKG